MKHHSTESALLVLKVHNDVIISMDMGEVTALTLLDLSAASPPLTMLHQHIYFLIGMGFLARLKFGFLPICKIGTNP